MKLNPNNSFSFQIIDPENPDKVDPCYSMVKLSDQCLVFNENGIYELLLAKRDSTGKIDEKARHTYNKLYSVGTTNSYVARIFLQFNEILNLTSVITSPYNDFSDLKKHVWQINRLILDCENSYFKIFDEAVNLIKICDELVEKNKNNVVIPALPQITDLNQKVFYFFNCAKKALVETYKILDLFYKKPYHGANFDQVNEWADKNLGLEHPISQALKSNSNWTKTISNFRNALEHSKDGLNVSVQNFKIHGNKFAGPTWKYDLTSVGLRKEDEYVDLIGDLNKFLPDMLTLVEETLFLCLSDLANFKNAFEICRYPNEKMNPKCPIAYYLMMKECKLS